MKTLMATCFALWLAGMASVVGQSTDSQPMSSGEAAAAIQAQAARLAASLNLTGDQVSIWTTIVQDSTQQAIAIEENSGLSEDQKNAQLLSVRDSGIAELRTLLTPTQGKQLNQIIKADFPPEAAPPPASHKTTLTAIGPELKLSSVQSAKWEEILRAARNKDRAALAIKSPMESQKKLLSQRDQQLAIEQLRLILTASQRHALDELMIGS
jgi:hypothetical protein